jgi:hypothetical protein
MPGVPVTGKGGTVTLTSIAGATSNFSLAPEVESYSYENKVDIVRGSRLSGPPFKAAGDEDFTGSITIYVAKSNAGTTLPFKAGDDACLTATFGNNTMSGQILISGVGNPEVSRGKYNTLKIDWEQNDSNFTCAPKIVTV